MKATHYLIGFALGVGLLFAASHWFADRFMEWLYICVFTGYC